MKNIALFLICVLLILEAFFGIQIVKQYTVYKQSNTQVILQKYQDQISMFKLLLVKESGTKKLKRLYYNNVTEKTEVYTLSFTKDMFTLKAYDPIAFVSVVICNQQETNCSVYSSYRRSDNLNTENFRYSYTYNYTIDSQFIPTKGSFNKIQIFDGNIVRINDKIIDYQGTQQIQNIKWNKIICLTDNFLYLFSQNAVYSYDVVIYNYLFSIQQISADYKCSPYSYKTSGVLDYNIVAYQTRFILYCYKFNIDNNVPFYDWAIKGYLQSSKYPKGIKIDQISGKTLQIPILKVSKRLQKFMITGKNINTSSLIIIKNINIIDLIFQDISIPQSMDIQSTAIQLTDWHLYARSRIKQNQKYKYSIYLIIATNCVLIRSSYLNSSQVENLISTFIYYPQHISFRQFGVWQYPTYQFTLQKTLSPIELSQLKLMHYYQKQTTYYIELTQFQTIKELQIQENSKFNGLQFSKLKNSNNEQINVFKDMQQAKRIYAYQPNSTSTLFVLESYIFNINVNITIDGIFSIGMISYGKSNCILAKDNSNTLVSIVFNEETKKLQKVQVHKYDKQILDLTNIFSQLQGVQSNCEGFIFQNNQIWRRKADSSVSPIYQKDQKLIEQFQDLYMFFAFSSNLKYALYYQSETNNYIYEYNNQKKQYKKIRQGESIGLYRMNAYDVNADNTRIMILSLQQKITIQSVTYFVNKPVILSKSSTQWNFIPNIQEVITTSNTFSGEKSPDFQTVVFLYNSGSIKKFTVLNINYQLNIIMNITNSSKILTQEYPMQQDIYLKVSNNYFYLRNSTHQFLLKLSKQKQNLGYNQIIMQNRIGLEYKQYLKDQYVIINENTNKIQQVSLIYYYMFQQKDVLNVRKKENDLFNQKIRSDLRGIIYDSQTGKIYQCVPGCQYCFNRNLCRKCKDGYYLAYQMKLCLRCSENCKTCPFSRPDICLSCFPKYTLVGSVCKRCHVNCFQCTLTSQNKCTSCRIDSTLISQSKINKTCIKCPGNCSYCQQSTKCKQCETGFTLDISSKCVLCPLSCNKCNPQALSSCLQCKIGYYMQKAQNFYQNITCKRCSNNCKLCRSSTQCYQCINLYRLHQIQLSSNKFNVICVVKCVLPCKQCNQNNPTQCLNCVEGYVYNKTTKSCDFDLSCNLFQNCTLCPYEYNLINNKCHACKTHQNCDSCYRYNFSMCLSCKKGYYLSQNECTPCSAECQECIIQNVCTKCNAGYLLQHDLPASQCIPCSTNCKTCLFTPANCLTCNQNMQIYGSRCISSIKIVLNITLNYDYNSFKNTDYEGITNQICKKSGKSREQVTIKSIKAGSVNLEGSILVQNLQDQTNTLNVLRGQFAQGSSVDGKTIISSSYTGSLTQPVVSNSGVNLKLILGIVIPISVVFIALIVFIIYRVRKAALEQNLKRAEATESTQSGASQKERTKRRNQRAAKRKMRNLPDSRSYVTTAQSSQQLKPNNIQY